MIIVLRSAAVILEVAMTPAYRMFGFAGSIATSATAQGAPMILIVLRVGIV